MFKSILSLVFVATLGFGAEAMPMHKMNMPQMDMNPDDERQSLGIKGTMQGIHQLSNMREHLAAVSEIVQLMNSGKYDEASKIASEKLGLTLEKNTMCGSFNNKSFEEMGVRFHKSADDLAQTLKTKDQKKSMVALEKVLNGCVMCHSTFKQ
jgi:cytochrome c556